MAQTTPFGGAPEEFTLSNGIPVILQHYDGSVGAIYWWNNVGSADEKPPEAGFSHFLEHMLFKDAAAKETGRASSGQLARTIESLGGDINAYTSFDQTVYHVTCAEAYFEEMVEGFGSMAKPQRFLKQDFDREREVILEELRKNEDSPGRQLFQELFTQTFGSHPYGRPVIGYVKTLKAARVGGLESYYRRHYVSGNMGLIVVGPFAGERKKNLMKLLEKRFGSKVMPQQAFERAKRTVANPFSKTIAKKVRTFDVQSPSMSISFRVPELSHPDLPALDLMASVLGMGELGRLYQRLFQSEGVVTEVSGGMYVPSDPGMLYFQADSTNFSELTKAGESLLDELSRIQKEGPSKEELERVLVNAESERLYATQSADGMAGRLGFMKFTIGDLAFDHRYLEQLRAVDAEAIKKVALKYLRPERMSTVTLAPKAAREEGVQFTDHLVSKSVSILGAGDVSSLRGGKSQLEKEPATSVESWQTPSGIRVVLNHRAQSPVFSVQAVVLGGSRLEQHPGLSYLMAQNWARGTSKKDSQSIARAVEGRAASLDGFSGRNSAGLQMTGLVRDWAPLSDLFNEVLCDPSFEKSELEHSLRVTEDSIKSIEDHSGQLVSKLFTEALFEPHPYSRILYGTLDSIQKIQPELLKRVHRAWVRPSRLVISVSGSISRTAVNTWIAAIDARLGQSAQTDALNEFLKEPELMERLKAPRWVESLKGREQAHLMVGTQGSTIHAKDRYVLRVLQNILGGQSGRLFIELREKKSLAYTVSPVSFEGIEPGYLGVYIASSPTKKEEALKGIQKVVETLAKKGPTPQELKRAQQYYLGQRAMELQGDSSLASHYGLEKVYGLPMLTQAQVSEAIRKVSAKAVRDLCEQYFVKPPMITAIVG